MTRASLFLCCLAATTAAACASSTAVPRPFPGAPTVSAPATRPETTA